MKPSSKAVMIGCISFFVFLYGNLLFGGFVGSLIPGGDDFIKFAFAQATNIPVGCLSDRTVLRTAQDGGAAPRQVRVCISNKHPCGVFERPNGLALARWRDFIPTSSVFYPLYTAVTLLISLIISCTYLILKKINLLLDQMEEK